MSRRPGRPALRNCGCGTARSSAPSTSSGRSGRCWCSARRFTARAASSSSFANVGCARTLLSERLATLVEHGVLRREPYREAGQRERHQYLLTEKGHDLFAALVALMHWGDRWEAGPDGGPVVVRHRDCNQPVHVELRCAHDHRVFEVEETESGPRPGLIDLSNSQP